MVRISDWKNITGNKNKYLFFFILKEYKITRCFLLVLNTEIMLKMT